MKYFIKTFGCQMNFHDSEVIAGYLESRGYLSAENMDEADLIVINGCTVRKSADDKVWRLLHRLQGRDFRDRQIWVVGCFAKAYSDEIVDKFSNVEKVIGPGEIGELENVQQGQKKVWVADKGVAPLDYFSSARQFSTVSAYVTVMKGCDNFCSYCIVPYVRGREQSRPPEEIAKEVEVLVQKGFTEIILLGQNVNSYGRGLKESIDFAGLLNRLAAIDGVRRIRFVTSHPKDISHRLIETMADNEKICKYLHFPLQSGSDRVLKRMNRGYTYKDYMTKVQELRRMIPEIELSSDFIVGFPGENETDFEASLQAVREAEFINSFVFMYSPRKGTAASRLPDDVPQSVKKERLQRLLEEQRKVSRQRLQRYIGSVQEILCDEYKPDKGQGAGRTDTNVVVNFKYTSADCIGKYFKVKVNRAFTFTLGGELL